MRSEIARSLATEPNLVLQAPTGSGKSTCVPGFVLDDILPRGQGVMVVQPRRLAARLLASRVARMRGRSLGGEVGYAVRLDRKAGPKTRILYVTEGITLQRMLSDPDLEDLGAVVIDEFHERHLYGDIALGMLKSLQATRRPDLRLVVMSATLEGLDVAGYLGDCPTLRAEGRLYPVETEYLEHEPNVRGRDEDPAAQAAVRELQARPDHSILIFQPGRAEIRRTLRALEGSPACRGVDVIPLHGDLPLDAQEAAITPGARTRVIVSTNIAETSITVEGVHTVVDAGRVRAQHYDPGRGLNSLRLEKISRASADQRAGRAGRLGPGRCLRLWTRADHAHRPEQAEPEIRRLDLSQAALMMRALGAGRPSDFPWFEPPQPERVKAADELLTFLGALEPDGGELTARGREMARLPLHPRTGRMLVEAKKRHCIPPVARIAALLESPDILVRRPGRAIEKRRGRALEPDDHSDFFPLLTALRMAEERQFSPSACRDAGIHARTSQTVVRLADSFAGAAGGRGRAADGDAPDCPPFDAGVREQIQWCLLAGAVDHLCRRRDRGTRACAVVGGRSGELDRDSGIRSDFFVAAEIQEIHQKRGSAKTLLRYATAVDPEWILELAPGGCEERSERFFDTRRRRVLHRTVASVYGLPLSERIDPAEPGEDATRLLAEALLDGRCPMPQWTEKVEAWIRRVNFLAGVCPELDIPAIDQEGTRLLLQQFCDGAVSYSEVKKRDFFRILRTWLTEEQRGALEAYAPEQVSLSNGLRRRLRYEESGMPVVSSYIQDFFGVNDLPRIAMGRACVRAELLAPNRRPAHLTDDLASFWSAGYARVRKELKGRYPKHDWPEHPPRA